MILATIVTSNYFYLTSSSYYKVLKCMCVMIIVKHSKYLIAYNYKGIIRVFLDIGVMSYD